MSADHDLLPYLDISEDDYAQRAADGNFVLDVAAPGSAILSGRCPRCGHSMTFPVLTDYFPKGVWHEKTSAAGKGKRETVEPMVCLCRDEHPGKPADVEGCGAHWKLILKFEPR